jgi:hypothetical protein
VRYTKVFSFSCGSEGDIFFTLSSQMSVIALCCFKKYVQTAAADDYAKSTVAS